MAPVGPLRMKRLPEPLRRHIDVAAATAWEALVGIHAAHALRFVALLAPRLPFDEAVDRYLAEMDVRDPMAASIRARVLIAVEDVEEDGDGRPSLHHYRADDAAAADPGDGLRRFRPDVLMKGMVRKARESEELGQWISLAIARAEEGVIKANIDNALVFAAVLDGHQPLDEAVEDYIEMMKISGGRAQAVYQRTMARLAELHLPDEGPSGSDAESGLEVGREADDADENGVDPTG